MATADVAAQLGLTDEMREKTVVRLRRTVMVLVLGAVLAGCSTSASPGEYRKEITLRGEPVSEDLLPANTQNDWENYLVSNLFTGLTQFAGSTGRPSRAVASKIESTDQTTWTITLRRGWTFHDGTPVTVASFINAWNYAADGANGMLQQSAFANIVGYEEVAGPQLSPDGLSGLTQIDTDVLQVTLQTPDSQFETLLATSAFSPVPDSWFVEGPSLVGNGPFVAQEVTNERVLLTRNAEYRSRKPLLTSVEFLVGGASGDVAAEIEAGVIDAAVIDARSAGGEPADVLDPRRETGILLEYLVYPLWDPRFADEMTRQALSMAIDRDQILAGTPEMVSSKATSWTVPNANGYSANTCSTSCAYNVEQARTTLAKAGGFDGPLVISYPSESDAELWIEPVCTSISNTLDLECLSNPLPTDQLNAAIASQQLPGPYLGTQRLPGIPTAAESFGPLYLTGAPLNTGGYSNPEFDLLFIAAESQPPESATKGFRETQRALSNNLPSAPLWYPDVYVLTSESVKTAELTPYQFIDITRTSVG